MNSKQPDKSKNDNIAEAKARSDKSQNDKTAETADKNTIDPKAVTKPLSDPKEVVDKVVNKLEELDDPNKTWTSQKKSKPQPELDLTLTEDDADYSTQPITIIETELKKGNTPEIANPIEPPTEITVSAQIIEANDEKVLAKTSHNPPWTLQQFFNGEIDLDVELARRFPTMPMMATLKTRSLGTNTGRKVAELATQDGAATMIIDADTASKVIQLSFTFGSMITLKFVMSDLNNMDRTRWVELMRRDTGGLAFLWGTTRWASDYLICISRKHFTNMYAFSPNNFEAGVRLTPTVTRELLDWLEKIWDEPEPDDEPPQLLTW